MVNLLVVDKDPALLQFLQKKLLSMNSDFAVNPVINVKEAIRNLEEEKVDLVITGLDLPGINGFEFLVYMNKHFSRLPVIVIVDQMSADMGAFSEDQAIFQYAPKPFDLEDLAWKISSGLAVKGRQSLRDFLLPFFLVLVSRQKKTYTLMIRTKNRNGLLYFIQGELFDAETEKDTGLPAALEIISWKATEIIIDFENIKKEKKISFKLEEILWGIAV
ncbi:MAG: response regulator [Desulfobacteraceae bacterium]|nr:MAG: response regulator [Desulfobacteraceae bacterium]